MLDADAVQTDVITFDVSTAAIKGARDYQQDSLISSFPLGQTAGFAVVADGLGGHVGGHIASALITAEIFSHLKMKENQLDEGTLNIPLTLRDATDAANARLAKQVGEDDSLHGMGSTLLVPVIRGDKLYWISVGDSPLLLFRGGALRQLNKDHSMAPQIDKMAKAGALTAEEAKDHPDRNTLTSVINGDEIDKIDCPTKPIALEPDDIIIASSDGLQYLSNSMIANTLMQVKDGRSVDIANAFLDAIADLDDPHQDNAAFVVIKLSVGSNEVETADAEEMPVLAVADEYVPEEIAEEEPPAQPDLKAAPTTGAPRAIRAVARAAAAAAQSERLRATQTQQAEQPEASATSDQPDERKAYWYRGQKYYKD
ncbi:protein phosphatase 2C domain-containing protein [Cognatiyoonia sp. IB215446]|uniref:PP2C family protein-serine/threonine phosphatase n=1 Tax=Cognatiyoonia sp. IB215446 TaxID=3097355 RepID=UPI002A0E09E3|nr:protein phosphatase 2C domain-containing protein [Cognatiyoonia sp. IB215446]MDX8347625.1 protein phosphatase 2C domain-containing protein [Cognatiyoonia sp. IB215446]